MALSREEVGRKLLHLFALLMPVSILYSASWSFPSLLVPAMLCGLFLASVGVEFLRFRFPGLQKLVWSIFGSMMRSEERIKISGWTWVIGAAFLCSVLFAKQPYISFIVLTLFILGDAAAALVGMSMGRIKIGKKTAEGSLGCFFTCLLLFFIAFRFVPGVFDNLGGKPPLVIGIVTSLIITIFELVPLKVTPGIIINDNLAVPVITGYVMVWMEKLLG